MPGSVGRRIQETPAGLNGSDVPVLGPVGGELKSARVLVQSVSFPHYPGKHQQVPVCTATQYRRYAARRSLRPMPRCPPNVLLVFGRRWRSYLSRRYGPPVLREYGLYRLAPGVGVSVVGGPGAPNAVLYVEELAAMGARRFVVIGMAGSLQPSAQVGSFVVCTRALRDEGTSFHYLGPAAFARPTAKLVRDLKATLDRHRIPYTSGPTWTTDAPYRETVAEVRRYRREGIVTVEMEASAVFSVARALGREAAALFVVSDLVRERGWEPRFHDSLAGLRTALRFGAEMLASYAR